LTTVPGDPSPQPADSAIPAASRRPKQLNPAYTTERSDLLALVPLSAARVLDVGCATGALGAAIRADRGAEVIGIELDPEMARVAGRRLSDVYAAAVEDVALEGDFDCMLFGDVLEHLADPWAVLRRLTSHLTPDGVVVASLPNAGHLDTLVHLFLFKRWPYRERGIHDRTHLHQFARRNVEDLFASAGLRIEYLHRHFHLLDRPSRVNRLAPFLAAPGLRDLLTSQFIVRARRDAPGASQWGTP
jgi:2-polyprenyl-3-methyl-5-hydroxy-6-metoxy-1,4-benzoquinol methylase